MIPKELLWRYAPAWITSSVLGAIQRLLSQPNIVLALCELAVGWYLAWIVYEDAKSAKQREILVLSFWQSADFMYAIAIACAVLPLLTFFKTID